MKNTIHLCGTLVVMLSSSMLLAWAPGGNEGGGGVGDTESPPAAPTDYSFTSLGTLGGD